jgi:hypothetical protein
MENTKLPYIAGGVIGLVGAALLYHYYTSLESEEEEQYGELYADLTAMGGIQKDASGMIQFEDFIKIFKLVTKHSKKQIVEFKQKNNEARRKHLRDGNDVLYKECIKKQIAQEENIYQEVATETLKFFDIEEQEFMMSQNMHAANPQFQKLMMEMQLGVDDGPATPPKVTKEKAKEIFIFVEDEKEKSMSSMKGAGGMPPQMMGNDMEATINMIVEHSKVGDKLFEKYGIEEEEFAKCIQYYNLIEDPDIKKLMHKSLQNMGPEALNMIAQMQGGMPQGGPPGGAPGGMGF